MFAVTRDPNQVERRVIVKHEKPRKVVILTTAR